ncbi:MAG: hypothetical protein FJX72_08815 [Armatimonadetes bacterium]|nr:hypothetical protein [Armatimonadota bacterium]
MSPPAGCRHRDGEPGAVNASEKERAYAAAYDRIERLVEGETDEVAVMATVACELHPVNPSQTG